MIEVSRLKDLNAAKLFLGFRIGAIRRRDFAVFPVQGQRGLRRLKSYFGDKMSVGAQMVVVLKAFVERCASLALVHPFEFSRLEVSQADVFHPFLLISCDSESGLAHKAPNRATCLIHTVALARWLGVYLISGNRLNGFRYLHPKIERHRAKATVRMRPSCSS